MRVLSVNVGQARAIANGKPSSLSGIYKLPVDGPVEVTAEGLHGDTIVDGKFHGGVDQAVYVYGTLDYDWWMETLEDHLAPGAFGENLTVSGLESAPLRIGDRLHVGSVTLEVTAPRGPCGTLAARMGDPGFVKRFRAVGRPGVYCRVIQGGFVEAGNAVRLEPYVGEHVTILEMFRSYYAPDADEATLRRFLAAPISVRDRVDKEEQLRKLR